MSTNVIYNSYIFFCYTANDISQDSTAFNSLIYAKLNFLFKYIISNVVGRNN